MATERQTRSILNVGGLLRAVLLADPEVRRVLPSGKIFPLLTEETELPYVCYRRTGMTASPVKTPGASRSVLVEFDVYAADYAGSLEIANAIAGALDGKQAQWDGLVMRSCTLADADESVMGEAVSQLLVFEVKV